MADGIAAERPRLAPLRDTAEHCVDTTGLRLGSCARARPRCPAERTRSTWRSRFCSFGHKHEPAPDADLTFDVRFLPNPHYEDKLRR